MISKVDTLAKEGQCYRILSSPLKLYQDIRCSVEFEDSLLVTDYNVFS
jgi:hypothetical protein